MSSHRRAVTTDGPQPLSLFAQGLRIGGLLQVSGQGPLDSSGTVAAHLDVEGQTALALANVAAILEAGGATFADVLSVRVFLTDRSLFAGMNAAYERFVREHLGDEPGPARTTVMVGLPLEGMLVEIDALAVVQDA